MTYTQQPTTDPMVPTRSIDRKLGGIHVMTPDEEIETLIRSQLRKARDENKWGEADIWTDEMAEQTVAYALWRHHENRAMYLQVMRGH